MRATTAGSIIAAMLSLSVIYGSDNLAAPSGLRPTTVTSIGLFYQPNAPEITTLWQPGDTGKRLQLRGRVLSTSGAPIADALVELWHADSTGSVDESRYRASQRSGEDGYFGIKTILPGHIERARYNDVFGARHVHIRVTHPDHEPLVSLIYFKGDERLANALYPELAIALDETGAGEDTFLFGTVEIVLP